MDKPSNKRTKNTIVLNILIQNFFDFRKNLINNNN